MVELLNKDLVGLSRSGSALETTKVTAINSANLFHSSNNFKESLANSLVLGLYFVFKVILYLVKKETKKRLLWL